MFDERVFDEKVVCIWSAGLTGRSQGLDKTLPDKTQHWFATSAPSALLAVEHKSQGKMIRDHYQELVIGNTVAFDEDAREKGIHEEDSLIGFGSFGVVRNALHRASQTHVVLKIIGREAAGPDYFCNMVERDGYHQGMRFCHPNVIRNLDCMLSSRNYFFAMQPLLGKELDDFVASQASVTELLIQSIAKQSLLALQYIHSNGLMHRDVKNDSFRFERNDPNDPGKLVLFDFGLSLPIWSPERLLVGTVPYMAPEVSSGSYGTPVDVWSLGVVLYTLITGDFPFEIRPLELFVVGEHEQACALSDPELLQQSPEVVQFLSGLMTLDASERVTADQALGHDWLCGAPDDMPSMDAPCSQRSQRMGATQEKYEDLVTRRKSIARPAAKRFSETPFKRDPSAAQKRGFWPSVLSLACCSKR